MKIFINPQSAVTEIKLIENRIGWFHCALSFFSLQTLQAKTFLFSMKAILALVSVAPSRFIIRVRNRFFGTEMLTENYRSMTVWNLVSNSTKLELDPLLLYWDEIAGGVNHLDVSQRLNFVVSSCLDQNKIKCHAMTIPPLNNGFFKIRKTPFLTLSIINWCYISITI